MVKMLPWRIVEGGLYLVYFVWPFVCGEWVLLMFVCKLVVFGAGVLVMSCMSAMFVEWGCVEGVLHVVNFDC